MGGFNNPVVGALALIRKAIRSPDYQEGTEGWSINQDGSAEFNDVVVRGEVDVVGTDGSRVKVDTAGGRAEVELTPPSQPGATYEPAIISTESDPDKSAALVLTSPREASSGPEIATIQLEGSDGTDPESNAWIVANKINLNGVVDVQGLLNPEFGLTNVVVGTALITPSAANTPTSLAVAFGPLTGSTFIGLITAATTVPGSLPAANGVTGVGITSVTDSGATLWVTRQNTTQTRVNYMVWGM